MEIEMKGPADRWISFGFGSDKMQETYAIIVAGDSITEHTLDWGSNNQEDTLLRPKPLISVQSDVTEGDYRTVTVQRSPTDDDINFEAGNLQIISATADPHGSSYDPCSYHGRTHRASDVVELVEYS